MSGDRVGLPLVLDKEAQLSRGVFALGACLSDSSQYWTQRAFQGDA